MLFLSDYQGENEKLWLDGRFIREAKAITASEPDGKVRYYVGITLDEKGTDLLKYTTEELIEMGKKAAYRNIESEMPTTEEYNKETGIFTIYRIIYK